MEESLLKEMERDPDQINTYTEIVFSDVFAEPQHVQSPHCTWTLSKTVFLRTNEICYRVLTAVLSLPIAFCCGLKFACLTFDSVWCCQPWMKILTIKLVPLRRIFAVFVHCIIDPFCEAFGMCYHIGRNGMDPSAGNCTTCEA